MNNSFTDNTLRSGSSEPASLGDATTMKGAPDGVGALGRIDQYELVRELGGGGFGVVFLARDAVSGVDVAVKGLPPLVRHNREELARIRENFALVARLHHPHIAAALVLHPAREVWYADEAVRRALRVDPGDTLMVMEYAPGTTLGNWRKQFPEGRAPVERALEVCRQAAEALDYAHSQKIVHRDVKPSNLMIETGNSKLETGGGSPRVVARVLDFGLAAEIRSSMSRVSQEAGDTSGTRPYMAPEQWAGRRQDGRADQYALAVLFHELVGGAVPFASAFDTGDPVIMQSAVLNLAPEPSPWLSKAQNAVLLRALAKDPAARFASCADFVAALGGGKISTRRRGGRGGDGWDEATRRRGDRGGRRWLWAAAAAALAAGAWFVGRPEIKGPAAGQPWTVPDLGLALMPVAAGSFQMGSEDGSSDEKPVRTVRISRDFWMGKTEVTNGEYDQFLRESGYEGASDADGNYLRHHRDWSVFASTEATHPVVCVSWKNAEKFCEWLTNRERTAGRLPQGYAYRLPTEAEWEYAARGGAKSKGFIYAGGNDIETVAWHGGNSGITTHPVGKKAANELGLHDMSGNVWEWCSDWHQDSYSGLPDTDPKGPGTGSHRVYRGGSWFNDASLCRSAFRLWYRPSDAIYDLGFRVVLAPVP